MTKNKKGQKNLSLPVYLLGAAILILSLLLSQQTQPGKTLSSQQPTPKPFSLEQIFQKDHSFVQNLPKDNTITLIATGDVLLGRTVNSTTVSTKNFTWPFEKTAEFTKSADITLINLEGPFVKKCPITKTGMLFCSDIRNVEGLKFAGVDITNLANNHIANYGQNGINETIEVLTNFDIDYTGLNDIIYKKVNRITFAFLGYNDISPQPKEVSSAKEEQIVKETQKAKKNADIVIASFHWGAEYRRKPTQRQKELAHLAIDSGADVVIGHHPHWIQPVEIYKDKVILYSHGNFVFDQMWSEETKLGLVSKFVFYEKKLRDVELLPVKIESFGQPYFLEGDQKQRILIALEQDSRKQDKGN